MKTITDEQFEKYEYALGVTESRENINYILEKILQLPEQDYSLTKDKSDIWSMNEVKLPKEGGILTYYDEHPYPKKGFPFEKIVDKIDVVKKTIVAVVYSLSKSKIILGITLIFFRKDLISAYNQLLVKLSDLIGQYCVLLPNRYCKSVQAISRAFEPTDEYLRIITTSILEFDDAYRYRFQDIIGEMDKQNFDKNPYTELSRLLDLVAFRESDNRLKETWSRAKKLLFVVSFSKELREKIITFFSKLDIENVKMEQDDLYFAKLKIGGYKWGEHKALVS